MRAWTLGVLALCAGCVDLSILSGFECDGGRCVAATGGGAASGGGNAVGGGSNAGGGSATGGGTATGGGAATGGGSAVGGGSGTGTCAGVSCGANATCFPDATSYTCTCASGYAGASVVGAPANCSEVDECLSTSTSCGPNAVCVNTAGSWLCRCPPGFVGDEVTGAATSCLPALTLLGQVSDGGAVKTPIALAAGDRLVAIGASSFGSPTISDMRNNTWRTVVTDGSLTGLVIVTIATTRVTQPLNVGDSISAQSGFGTATALWVARLNGHHLLDNTGSGAATSPGAASVSAVAATGGELLSLGVIASSGSSATYSADGGLSDFSFDLANGLGSNATGVVMSKLSVVDGGSAVLGATVNPSVSGASGAIATFVRGPPVLPTNVVLTHTPNNRTFITSWDPGRGNGAGAGCAIQYLRAGVWQQISLANCDVKRTPASSSLPSAGWDGGWGTGFPVRVVRLEDDAGVTFPTLLTCNPTGPSTVTTQNIDENCNGQWDEHTCVSWGWLTVGTAAAPSAPCPDAGVAPPATCGAAQEKEERYTAGVGSTTQSPSVGWSSSTVGTACGGDPDGGATRWECRGSMCSYY